MVTNQNNCRFWFHNSTNCLLIRIPISLCHILTKFNRYLIYYSIENIIQQCHHQPIKIYHITTINMMAIISMIVIRIKIYILINSVEIKMLRKVYLLHRQWGSSLKRVYVGLGRFWADCHDHYQDCDWVGDIIDAVYCQQNGVDLWLDYFPQCSNNNAIWFSPAP